MTDTTVLLYDLLIFGGSKQELLDLMYLRIKEGNGLVKVATPNPEQVVQSLKNKEFLDHLKQFDLLLPDGQGLVWASQLLTGRGVESALKQRIAGREVVAALLLFAQKEEKKVLLLGGREYQGCSFENIKVVLPQTNQTYDPSNTLLWLPGYEDIKAEKPDENQVVAQTIKQFKPDIVFVAFGAPYQEAWVINHQQLLEKAGVKLVMVVGGSFDYLFGNVPHVPTLVEKLGVEWLFRLLTQPWRWKRQLRLLSFIRLTFAKALSN